MVLVFQSYIRKKSKFRKKVQAFSIYILRNLKKLTFLFLKSFLCAYFLVCCKLLKHLALHKTPLGEIGCLSDSYNLLFAQGSSFLIHPFSQSKSVRTYLVPFPHCAALVWLTGYHAAPLVTKYFPSQQLAREEEDFPRDGKYPRDVPLFNYLD